MEEDAGVLNPVDLLAFSLLSALLLFFVYKAYRVLWTIISASMMIFISSIIALTLYKYLGTHISRVACTIDEYSGGYFASVIKTSAFIHKISRIHALENGTDETVPHLFKTFLDSLTES